MHLVGIYVLNICFEYFNIDLNPLEHPAILERALVDERGPVLHLLVLVGDGAGHRAVDLTGSLHRLQGPALLISTKIFS